MIVNDVWILDDVRERFIMKLIGDARSHHIEPEIKTVDVELVHSVGSSEVV